MDDWFLLCDIQSVPGEKVNILGGHSIGHCNQKNLYVHVSYSEIELFHCTDEPHAMSSLELQSALMLTAEFSQNVLYKVNCTNFVTWTINIGIRNSTKFLRIDGVAWSAQQNPTSVNIDFLDPEPLRFNSCSSSVIITRLSGHRSRTTASQKIWKHWESNTGSLDL
jgi:hypothetical protein